MAYSHDPSEAAAAAASAFENARLTPEEAERLAASFRPSWELDEVSFHAPSAPASVSASVGAGGDGAPAPKSAPSTAADVRSVVQALNGTHAPAPSLILHEPSVIVDAGVMNDTVPRRVPAALAAAPAADASSEFGRIRARSMTGVWAGIAVAVLAVGGLGVWIVSGSGEKSAPAAPALEPPHATAAESKIPPPPPAAPAPPAATHASSPAAPPSAPAAADAVTAAASPPAATAAPPPVAPSPPPPAPPPPAAVAAPARLVVPPAPRPPTWSPPASQGSRATRPKGNSQTIVRDVPF